MKIRSKVWKFRYRWTLSHNPISSNYSTAGLIKLKLSYIYQIHYALESLIPLSLIWAKRRGIYVSLDIFSHKMLFLLNMVRNGISGYFITGNLFHLILALIGQEGDLRGACVNNGVLILSRKHFLCLILLACLSAVRYILRTSEFLRTQEKGMGKNKVYRVLLTLLN